MYSGYAADSAEISFGWRGSLLGRVGMIVGFYEVLKVIVSDLGCKGWGLEN